MCRATQNLGRDEAASWRRTPLDHERRTVLFEGEDPAEAFALSRALDAIDMDTMWCPGPRGGGGASCPLVEEGHCDLFESADVVLNNLGTTDDRCADVAKAADRAAEGKRVVVVALRDADGLGAALTHSEVVPGPLTGRRVRAAVQST